MNRAGVFLALLCLVSAKSSKKFPGDKSNDDQVCFKNLGCFSTGYPWTSELRPLPRPADPMEYGATFLYYNRDNMQGTTFSIYPDIKFHGIEYNPKREKTVIVMPGTGSQRITETSWTLELKDALLSRLDANVFLLNTTGGQKSIDVFFAAANVPVIAAQVTRFIEHLKKDYHLNYKDIWIIAFGVGSHQAGIVGNHTHIARITGLDPQQQLYEGHPEEVRLSVDDADFVDVIHTDSRPLIPDIGVGFMSSLGDVDIYLNGAHQQPGCRFPRPYDLIGQPDIVDAIKEPVRLIVQSVLCAHKFAHRVFIQSIANQDCTFWGHPGTYENFLRGISNAGTEGIVAKYTALLSKCDLSTCVPLGLDTEKTKLRGVFIVTTTGNHPYCLDSKNFVDFQLLGQQEYMIEKWLKSFYQGNKENSDFSWPK